MQPLFRQLFDRESSTYTYLLADPGSGEACLIDPVLEQVERDLRVVSELGCKLVWILETHIHADHITGAAVLRERTGAKVALSSSSGVKCADLLLSDGQELPLGRFRVRALATPGHTNTCLSYFCEGRVFTGDALFIRDAGRTDFQEGSSQALYESITRKLFALPDDTLVFPAHDYNGLTSSTILEERRFNAKLGGGKSLAEFQAAMAAMKLGLPKRIHEAVPANLRCGKSS